MIAGCTPVEATGGSGVSVTNLETLVSKITWAGGRGTTVAKVTHRVARLPGQCPSGTRLVVMVGTVTGGSGIALTTIKVGQILSARMCVTPKSTQSLEPGSGFKLTTVAKTRPTTTTTTTTRPPTTTTTTTAPSGTNPPPAVAMPAGLAACPTAANSAMIALVNRDRQQTANLAPLTENASLDWAARKHSIMMASTSTMTHTGWDTEISESHFVVSAPGWTGQNIAWMTGGYSPATIESMFFNEVAPNDGHRRNILSTNFHKIGIGCAINNATGAYWWTQDFGS